MRRRDILKAIPAALAAPRIVKAAGATTVTFAPHADLASLDPVWTTADITRNYSLAVFDTLLCTRTTRSSTSSRRWSTA